MGRESKPDAGGFVWPRRSSHMVVVRARRLLSVVVVEGGGGGGGGRGRAWRSREEGGVGYRWAHLRGIELCDSRESRLSCCRSLYLIVSKLDM